MPDTRRKFSKCKHGGLASSRAHVIKRLKDQNRALKYKKNQGYPVSGIIKSIEYDPRITIMIGEKKQIRNINFFIRENET